MNRAKIEKLSGQALRDAVAIEVMGWTSCSDDRYSWWCDPTTHEIVAYAAQFQPDLSMSDAWRVVEKVQQRLGFDSIYLYVQKYAERPGCKHICTMFHFSEPSKPQYSASADTMPTAICRAALLCVQAKGPKGEDKP